MTVTHKALAFPASSAHQPCGVVSLQPVKHWYQFTCSNSLRAAGRDAGTLRRHGAADDDRSAGGRAAASRLDAGGRAG